METNFLRNLINLDYLLARKTIRKARYEVKKQLLKKIETALNQNLPKTMANQRSLKELGLPLKFP